MGRAGLANHRVRRLDETRCLNDDNELRMGSGGIYYRGELYRMIILYDPWSGDVRSISSWTGKFWDNKLTWFDLGTKNVFMVWDVGWRIDGERFTTFFIKQLNFHFSDIVWHVTYDFHAANHFPTSLATCQHHDWHIDSYERASENTK